MLRALWAFWWAFWWACLLAVAVLGVLGCRLGWRMDGRRNGVFRAFDGFYARGNTLARVTCCACMVGL